MSTAPQNALAAALRSTTRLSQVLAGTLVIGYLTQLVFPPARMYLAMVAGRTIPCGWNVVTAGLLEQHILTLAVSVAALLALSRVIEPVYGSYEYLKFLAMVDTAAGLGAFITVYIAYALDRNEEGNLLYSEISGFHGVIAGILVAVKQLTPDTEVTVLQVVKLRAKHLAALYVLVASVTGLFLHCAISTVPFVVCGAYSAWFYLRFFQPSPTDPTQQGDNSPDFRFATFFPAPVHPVVDRLADAAARVCRLDRSGVGAAAASSASATVPLAKSAEASRRRERGARALEERLGLKSTVAVSKEDAAPHADVETGLSSGNGDMSAASMEAATAAPTPALDTA